MRLSLCLAPIIMTVYSLVARFALWLLAVWPFRAYWFVNISMCTACSIVYYQGFVHSHSKILLIRQFFYLTPRITIVQCSFLEHTWAANWAQCMNQRQLVFLWSFHMDTRSINTIKSIYRFNAHCAHTHIGSIALTCWVNASKPINSPSVVHLVLMILALRFPTTAGGRSRLIELAAN